MRVLLHILTALLALVVMTISTPITPAKHVQRFTLQQGDKIRAPRAPAMHYLRALRKHQGWVPDNVASAAKKNMQGNQTGTATAIPEEFDSEYLTPITVGGQAMNVAVDTGSTDLWVFSNMLSTFALREHDFYTPGPGSKKMDEQVWRVRYGDGSTASGDVYIDNVTMAGISSPQQAFGAASRVSDMFIQDENNDGIMGLSFTSLSRVKPNKQPSWFTNVKDKLAEPLYTVALKRNAPGTFDFGFIDQSKYTGDITYTPINNSSGFWNITIDGYQVSGGQVQDRPFTGIVDTGTTLLLIPLDVARAYYSRIPNSGIGNMTGGFEFPCDARLPDFTLVIDGYEATVPGEHVKYQPILPGHPRCFGGIQPASDPTFSVFGDVLLKSQFVVFDMNGPRVGWAKQA